MLAGDVSALYLAMDWQHMLVQRVVGNPDRRAHLAGHLRSTCLLFFKHPGCSKRKRCLTLCIGACIFALRQLDCNAAVISWVQDHAQVVHVTCSLSYMLSCTLKNQISPSCLCYCLLLPFLSQLSRCLYPKEKQPMPTKPAAADTFSTNAACSASNG